MDFIDISREIRAEKGQNNLSCEKTEENKGAPRLVGMLMARINSHVSQKQRDMGHPKFSGDLRYCTAARMYSVSSLSVCSCMPRVL